MFYVPDCLICAIFELCCRCVNTWVGVLVPGRRSRTAGSRTLPPCCSRYRYLTEAAPLLGWDTRCHVFLSLHLTGLGLSKGLCCLLSESEILRYNEI